MLNTEKIKKLLDEGDNISVKAKKIGVNRSYLYDIRNGKTNIGSDLLEKLADYFNVSVGYFFDEEVVSNTASVEKVSELQCELARLRHDLKVSQKLDEERDKIISLLRDIIADKDEIISLLKRQHQN